MPKPHTPQESPAKELVDVDSKSQMLSPHTETIAALDANGFVRTVLVVVESHDALAPGSLCSRLRRSQLVGVGRASQRDSR